MDYFEYKNGRLYCEEVPVEEIASSAGTPVYIYSAATLRYHYREIAKAFAPLEPTICYSIKSLSNLSVLKLLAGEGSGFDVVSGGELARARAAGGDMAKVVYAGVGKTDAEISQAIAAGIGLFNVESEAEFENLSRLAEHAGKFGVAQPPSAVCSNVAQPPSAVCGLENSDNKTPVRVPQQMPQVQQVRAALRVNPDIDPKTHRYTSTGKKETKFGVDIERAERFFQAYGRDQHVRLEAIHLHIGSPIYTAAPYVEAITKTLTMIERLRSQGFTIDTLDIGGGFAADYEHGKSPEAQKYADAIVPLLAGRGLKVILEPGRQIAANSGILLGRVLYVKQGGERNFVIVDAAMTDLIRPALYDAQHFIWPARLAPDQQPPERRIDQAPPGGVKVDVVGGVCESSDFLAKDRVLPPVARGDLLAVFTAGAYGFVMSSQYNSRPRAAEILVEGPKWQVVRRRETYDDLLAAER